MTDREQKIIGNMNLVHYIVHKHFPQYTANQDIIQNGYVGLIKAVDSFDESTGNTFSTYAARCIFNEILMDLRRTCFAVNLGNCNSEYFKSLPTGKYDAFMPFAFNGEKYTVSMYSTTANVSEICKKHGGGGHCHAAGFVCSELPF